MTEEDSSDRFRTIVYGIAATATLGFLGWVGLSVNGMTDRLVTLEVTVREARAERLQQVEDLRVRVGRLEEERAARYRAAREEAR